MAESDSPRETSAALAHEDHLKREWDKLNKEIENYLKKHVPEEKYSITIIAGVASWVLAQPKVVDQPCCR
jgi:hypothetical protein